MERFELVDPFVFLMRRDNFQFKALKTKKITLFGANYANCEE